MSTEILVLDPSPEMRRLVREILQPEGLHVRELENAAAWLKDPDVEPPALVICDADLTRGEGLALVAMLHASPQRDPDDDVATPVGAPASRHLAETTRRLATRLRVKAVLPKPFEPQALLRAVREALAGEAKDPLPDIDDAYGDTWSPDIELTRSRTARGETCAASGPVLEPHDTRGTKGARS